MNDSTSRRALLPTLASIRTGLRACCAVLLLMIFPPAWAEVHLLLERDTPSPGLADLFLLSYPDQAAFLTQVGFTQTDLPLALNAGFSAGGLAIDASGGWHLLLERDTPSPLLTDLFLLSYPDQAAFLSQTGFIQTDLPLALNAGFSAGGLAIDASGGWHLLLERDTPSPLLTDLFLLSYPDQAAFLTQVGFTQTDLPLALNAGFSAGGLAIFDASQPPPPGGVPEPPTWSIVAFALALLILAKGRPCPSTPDGRCEDSAREIL